MLKYTSNADLNFFQAQKIKAERKWPRREIFLSEQFLNSFLKRKQQQQEQQQQQ